MANKSKKSAYYWFMMEIMEDLRQKGQPVQGGMSKVAELARPKWNQMTPAQRKPYEDKAHEFKNTFAKLDNQQNPIHLRTDPLLEYERARSKEIESVMASWPADLKDLSTVKFCFIDFQIVGKVEPEDRSPTIYLPAEVAVSEFSLRDGITNTFHEFLRPPQIPMGGRWACQLHSDNTNRIPLEGHQSCTSDYTWLYERITSFLNAGGVQGVPDHFYVPMANYDSTVYCLEWLHSMAYPGTETKPQKPYELESLLIALTFRGTGKMISKKSATETINTSDFHYVPGTKCTYHDNLECFHCSLAFVRQYCFSICDCLCGPYQIQITSRHNPHHAGDDSNAAVVPAPTLSATTSRMQEPKRWQQQKPQQQQEVHMPQWPATGPRLPSSSAAPWALPAGSSMQSHHLHHTFESMRLTDDFPPMVSRSSGSEVGGATASAGAGAAFSDAVGIRQGRYAVPPVRLPIGGVRPPPGFGDSNWPRLGPAGQDVAHRPRGEPMSLIAPATVRPTAAGTGRGNAVERDPRGRPGGDFHESDSFSLWKKE